MKFTVTVKAKASWSLKARQDVLDALAFAVGYYDFGDIRSVEIKLCGLSEGYDGYALNLDSKGVVKLFTPALSAVTLFHELTHLQQFGVSRLVFEEEDACWEGKRFSKFSDDDDEAYRAQPWEVEARKMERLMMEEYNGS